MEKLKSGGKLRSGAALTVLLAVAGALPAARAQEAPPPPPAPEAGGLEEVIVTANKRQENLQEVPTSAQAFSSADLQALHVTKVTDIANLVPGVQVISPNTNTDNFFSIRGVSQNDFSEHQESPVAVYLDDVYMSQAAGTQSQLFDVDRVEALRGPQGTLFGRNATGGLVQYFSKRPTDDFQGDAELTVGSYDQIRFEGAVSGPVTQGLDMRLALVTNSAEPWLKNDLAHGDDPNNQNDKGIRFQTLWKPTDDLEVLLLLRGGETHTRAGFYRELPSYQNPANHLLGTPVPSNVSIFGTCPGCDFAGYQNDLPFYEGASGFPGHNEASTLGSTLNIKYRIGDLNLVSVSDFTKVNKNYAEDSATTPVDEVHYFTFTNVQQISQDLHVDNGAKGRFRWVAGFYYLHIDGGYREGVTLGPVYGGPVAYDDPYKIETTSYAPYAQGEYDIMDDLTLTVGGRWSQDEKTMSFTSNQVNGSEALEATPAASYSFNQALYGQLADLSRGDWSARVALEWHATDGIMPYVSWNRGLKGGGFNAPLTGFNPGAGPSIPSIPASTFKFYEEKLDAFETGVKSEFWGRKARVNADVFYYDYQNYQAFNFVGLSQLVFNAPATITGGELQTTVLPLDGLRLDFGAAILDAEANNVPLPDGTLTTRKMVEAPRVSLDGRVDYSHDLDFGGTLSVETDFSWRTGVYFSISNAPSVYEGPLWLQNFHVTYTAPDGHWTFGGFLENAFDKHYYNNMIDVSSLGFTQRVIGMPRWFGFRLGYEY
jgi:iron complex outermembrane receptor protein